MGCRCSRLGAEYVLFDLAEFILLVQDHHAEVFLEILRSSMEELHLIALVLLAQFSGLQLQRAAGYPKS